MNSEKEQITEDVDNQSEDDWYDQMEKFAMNRSAERLDDEIEGTPFQPTTSTENEVNEDAYFESLQNDVNNRIDTFVGEEDRMWQDLIRTMRNDPKQSNSRAVHAKSHNGTNNQYMKVDFFDESANILTLQWLFSYLPKSLVIIKQLEGYLQQNNGLLVVDHVEHPSITVASFFNKATKAIHVSLFSSLVMTNKQLLLHMRQLQAIYSAATSLRLVAVGRDIYEAAFVEATNFRQEWVEYCDMYCCLETGASHSHSLQTIVDSLSYDLELSTLRYIGCARLLSDLIM